MLFRSRLFYGHFHLRRDALARSPFLALAATAPILAQKDFLRPSSAFVFGLGAGGLRLLPVALLYRSLPLAVNPAPAFVDNFSPRPTARDTDFLAINVIHYLKAFCLEILAS